MELPAVHYNKTGIELIRSKQGSRHFSSSGADQTGDTEDLSSAHFEADICQHCRALISGVTLPAQALDPKHRLVGYFPLLMGEQCFYFATDHEPDDAIDG